MAIKTIYDIIAYIKLIRNKSMRKMMIGDGFLGSQIAFQCTYA
ncbi:hypothetical protein [uncultured Ruminococcus sp.]|nr:hypothetical protein [uncultured Ruminococcus sp.]